MSEMTFQGRNAVVTGGGGGMGLATALALLERGAHLTLIDIKAPPDELRDHSSRCRYCRGDICDEAFVRDAVESAFAATGRLDYLVNAAGVLWFDRDRSALEMDLDDWDRVMAINLRAMVHTTRHAAPLMKRSGGGAMVHVSSTQCLRGDSRPQDAYQAAKAGVLALSKSLAIQLAEFGIRSNALIPGPTTSPMQARWQAAPELAQQTAARIPLGRVGTPQDMAAAILFLLSDAASFITATELVVDGGLTALP